MSSTAFRVRRNVTIGRTTVRTNNAGRDREGEEAAKSMSPVLVEGGHARCFRYRDYGRAGAESCGEAEEP